MRLEKGLNSTRLADRQITERVCRAAFAYNNVVIPLSSGCSAAEHFPREGSHFSREIVFEKLLA
jgi:hypothetical protein